MKGTLIFIFSFLPFIAFGEATQFTDEDRERLIRLESTLREFKDSVDKRFEQIDKRFEEFRDYVDKRFEQIDKRFEQMITFLWILSAIFVGIVGVTIAFALWDRRTMTKPFEERIKEEQKKTKAIISILKELSETHNKLAFLLKKFGLL